MIDLQSCSSHQQHKPPLQELQLLHQHKPDSHQSNDAPSAYSIWKKPKTPYPDSSSQIAHSSSKNHSSSKKKPSGELSCELGLSILDTPRRVCRICHRYFSSGRALGGHMRVHGPLFQPAGSKRKLESKDSEDGYGMEFLDSKDGNLSLLSTTLLDKQVDKAEDDVMSFFSESEGEAVEDAQASKANVHHTNTINDSDDEDGTDEYYGYCEAADDDHLYSSTKNPLYQLRNNPKRSRRFADDEFAMGLLLPGQGTSAKRSAFSSLEKLRVCSECGKAFWSWKALFGHMRCHPEREWRGILPPGDSSVHEGRRFSETKPYAKSSFVESSENELESDVEDKENYMEGGGLQKIKEDGLEEKALQMVEEGEVGNDDMCGEEDTKELAVAIGRGNDWNPHWPTAGKRSRRKLTEGKAESIQQVNSGADEEEPALTSESTSLLELGEETPNETPNFLFMLAEAARKIEQDTEVKKNLLPLRPDMPYYTTKHVKDIEHPPKAKQSVAATSSTSSIQVKYECSTCKKSFNSHQALGGHRASHRKMKGCFARTTFGDDMDLAVRDELSLDNTWQVDVQEREPFHLIDKKKQQQTKVHQCTVCNRTFATGQALGGHKRCHYSNEKVAEAASVTSSNKQLLEEGHTSKCDEEGSVLDLNMPAPDEREVVCASAVTELRLFHDNLDDERERNQEGLSLEPWTKKGVLGGESNGSWARWAMGSAVAY